MIIQYHLILVDYCECLSCRLKRDLVLPKSSSHNPHKMIAWLTVWSEMIQNPFRIFDTNTPMQPSLLGVNFLRKEFNQSVYHKPVYIKSYIDLACTWCMLRFWFLTQSQLNCVYESIKFQYLPIVDCRNIIFTHTKGMLARLLCETICYKLLLFHHYASIKKALWE